MRSLWRPAKGSTCVCEFLIMGKMELVAGWNAFSQNAVQAPPFGVYAIRVQLGLKRIDAMPFRPYPALHGGEARRRRADGYCEAVVHVMLLARHEPVFTLRVRKKPGRAAGQGC